MSIETLSELQQVAKDFLMTAPPVGYSLRGWYLDAMSAAFQEAVDARADLQVYFKPSWRVAELLDTDLDPDPEPAEAE